MRQSVSPSTDRVTLRRSTILAGLAVMLVSASWAGGTTWFLMKRDDLASRMLSRETSRQYAYEDRIASLRHEIERLAGRQIVDTDGVEARLTDLMTRQGQLESRQAIVTALTEQLAPTTATAGLGRPPASRAPLAGQSSHPPVQPGTIQPLPPTVSGFVAPLKPTPEADLPSLRRLDQDRTKSVPATGWSSSSLRSGTTLDGTLSQIGHALTVIDTRQIAALNRIESHILRKRSDMRAVVAATGLNIEQLVSPSKSAQAQGGPFVPYKVDPKSGPFESVLSRIQPAFIETERLSTLSRSLPLTRPLPLHYEMTSTFGYRADPFTRAAAMHTGIDFRAEPGTPVRATAPGKVVTSGYQGGYGNMVEIDHGHGLTTRYAHLSALLVDEGDTVIAGTVVGRVGSTGRSTGPHLHYETRLDDEALDPRRFLRAGEKIGMTVAP